MKSLKPCFHPRKVLSKSQKQAFFTHTPYNNKRLAGSDPLWNSLFPMGEIPGGGVSGGVNNLLDFIKANPGKKSREIKAALNLPQRTLERWLKELREQKKIKFQGPPKTGGIIFWMKNSTQYPTPPPPQ
ncbi:MAG: hypothetical protein K9K62_11755 [Desulfobacteraceae bacterium]|nr:hypothetical protein [Desulfobacteraceae bacterium]